MLEPVARWVIRQDAAEDELRWQLINDDRLHVIERSKLLERLVGRAGEADVLKRANELMESTEEELLKVACENLSTAASEPRMNAEPSGSIRFRADATNGASHHLTPG